jgi:hypothetical protein
LIEKKKREHEEKKSTATYSNKQESTFKDGGNPSYPGFSGNGTSAPDQSESLSNTNMQDGTRISI